jgi:hypothetical protein
VNEFHIPVAILAQANMTRTPPYQRIALVCLYLFLVVVALLVVTAPVPEQHSFAIMTRGPKSRRLSPNDSDAELQQSEAFRRSVPHVTMSALSAVLRQASSIGIPALSSRSQLREARERAINVTTPYGPLASIYELVPAKPNVTIKLRVVSMLSLLDHMFRSCPGFKHLMMSRHTSQPSSPDAPWRLIIYGDEVTPGAQISARNFRKFWAVYASLLEFGPLTLSNDKAWFELCVKESHEVSKACDGASQMFKVILKNTFCGATDPEVAGVVLGDPRGEHVRLFFKLGIFLMDGDAHRTVWRCMGDSGLKMCMLCLNLYTRDSGLVDEDGTKQLCCTLVHETDLILATDEDIYACIDRLAAHKLTDSNPMFEMRQRAVGFRFAPESVLMDPALRSVVRPVSSFCHDTQHAWFSSGVFNTVVYLFFETLWLGGLKNIYDAANTFVMGWNIPSMSGSAKGLYEIFSKNRVESWRKAKHLKCSAGECLGLYLILALFVRKHVWPVWPNQCNAFLSMCDVIDIFVCVPYGTTTPQLLGDGVRKFLDACITAGWREFFHPKWHWLVHMRTHYENFGWLPACWVLERKHKVPKAFAQDCRNTVTFDKTVLDEILAQHFAELSDESVFQCNFGLVGAHAASAKMCVFLQLLLHLSPAQVDTIKTSVKARFGVVGTCRRGDIVLVKDGDSYVAAELCFLAMIQGLHFALLSVWSLADENLEARSATWNAVNNYRLYPLADILAVCWYKRYAGTVVTLRPPYIN